MTCLQNYLELFFSRTQNGRLPSACWWCVANHHACLFDFRVLALPAAAAAPPAFLRPCAGHGFLTCLGATDQHTSS